MTAAQHFGSVSGGKDSQAVLCLMRERLDQGKFRGNLKPRFVSADTGNEHPLWHEHMAYLDDWLFASTGLRIEIVKADFSGEFERRREVIRALWPQERRRKEHSAECKALAQALEEFSELEPSEASDAAWAAWKAECAKCKVRVSPPLPPEVIEAACAALQPSGNPFLDLCMLKGRFPGARTRFCTQRLKLEPMETLKRPLLDEGLSIVEWIGERAQESPARANKPRIQRIRHPRSNASRILYRPIHHLEHRDVFEISKRHGLKPNPLYLMGMGRVGCWPCILEKKKGVRVIATRTPQEIDRLEEWERRVRMVSRRADATFFCAKMIPGEGDGRAHIRAVVEWSQTSHGGRNFDMFLQDEMRAFDRDGLACDSEYGLCE
jgi:3'-phosphoadenosine 5'-phosphosulfate sulfotransferase (PAPS reductase)/FAD synthetase